MRSSISSMLVLVLAVAAAVGQSPDSSKASRGGTTPAASSSQSTATVAPRPSPTPTPPPPNPRLASAPITTTAQYSPTRLDFGTVPEGQSAKRTLTVTPPVGGAVTLSLPKDGWFWLAEFRELGPLGGGSKNSPMGPMSTSIQRQLKARTVYQAGLAGDAQWNIGEGSAIQIDLVFQPKLNTLAASGPISIWVQLKGPGPLKAWSVSVPACGVFEKKPPLIQGPGSGAPKPEDLSSVLGLRRTEMRIPLGIFLTILSMTALAAGQASAAAKPRVPECNPKESIRRLYGH